MRVQRLRAVRERVHRRPDRLRTSEPHGQPDVVDDPGRLSTAAAAARTALRISDSEVRRPFRARVRRRQRDQRPSGRRRDRLAEVDRAAAADRDDAVAAERRRLLDARRRHLAPAPAELERQLDLVPARARDQHRSADTDLLADLGDERRGPPADDHRSLVLANSTNAWAERVSARPPERTSKISRAGSSPSTRATATVPAATSSAIAAREMNVTP